MKLQVFTTENTEKKSFRFSKSSVDLIINKLVKSRHSREGGNPGVLNFLKRMDSRLITSGMTASERTFHFLVTFLCSDLFSQCSLWLILDDT